MAFTESPDFLPEALRKAWTYYGLFPNAVIVTTPETVGFYQEFPVAVGRSVVRGAVYRHASESRRQGLQSWGRRATSGVDSRTPARRQPIDHTTPLLLKTQHSSKRFFEWLNTYFPPKRL